MKMNGETVKMLLERFHQLGHEWNAISRKPGEYNYLAVLTAIEDEQDEIANELRGRGYRIPGVTEPKINDGGGRYYRKEVR